MAINRTAILFLIVASLASSLFAYEYPISETAIRKAYFLGTANNGETKKFLAQYTHTLPMPKAGAHVASVTLYTPYARIVEYSGKALNFSAVDAVQKFQNSPPDFQLRVELDLTASYTPIISSDSTGTHLRTNDFWRDFRIRLTQRSKTISPGQVTGEPIYVGTTDEGGDTLRGAAVTLNYPADELVAEPAAIDVITPDGQDVRTQFDLAELK